MKKFLGYILVLALFLVAPIALVGCGAELESIYVKKNTIKQTYIVGEQVEDYKSTAKVYAVYSDRTEKLVDNSEVEFSTISTQEIGEQTLTITYKDKECKVKITVYNNIEDSYEMTGFEMPSFVNLYNENKAEKQNKETEFVDREQTYTVGTDNGFVFLPIITALNEQKEPITLNAYKSVAKIYLKGDADSYSELTGEAKDNLVFYNDETSTFKFTANAIDKQFKIEVKPYYYPDIDALSFEFKVGKGYNVYDADGLSVIDNATTEEEGGINWSAKRAETGIGEVDTSAVFIHNNLTIKNENLPTYLFYKETDADSNTEINGSLRDYMTLYYRVLKDGESFSINGNYFSIDVQKVNKIKKFNGDGQKDQISHAQLFKAFGKDTNSKDTSHFEIKNINIIGNAEHSEKETENAGGLIFVKMNNCQALAQNIMTRFNVIDWFSEENSSFSVDSVKSYDSYSSMIYTWRKSAITIRNSEMKRCGGPLAIIDHANSKENTDQYNNMIVENSVLENFVTGQEAWFNNMGVSSKASSIVAMNNLILGYSGNTKTYIKKNDKGVDSFNCLYVLYDGGNLGLSEPTTKGTLNINGFAMDLTGQDTTISNLRSLSPLVLQLRNKNADDTYKNTYIYTKSVDEQKNPILTTLGSSNPTSVPADFAGAEGCIGIITEKAMTIVLGLYDVA